MRIGQLEVRNFRSIEHLVLNFPGFYTAICGRNNAGKTTVVRALRALLPDNNPFGVFRETELSYKDDVSAWLRDADAPIELTTTFEVDHNKDAGLHKFIERLGGVKLGQAPCSVKVSLRRLPGSKEGETEVRVDGQLLEAFAASEIVKKLRSAGAVLFHNSTENEGARGMYRHGFAARLGEFTRADREGFAELQKKVDRYVRQLTRGQQKEVEELIGRLEDKYKVGLTAARMNVEWTPVEISLGHKSFSVPLNDWGSGTRNRTMVLLTLLRAKKAAQSADESDRLTPVLVIEEPESFLHPSAQAEFGRILQEFAEELEVQVITTTHSPYMLSVERPGANILLQRRVVGKEPRETEVLETSGNKWMEPFALALGIDNKEFEPWQAVMHGKANNVLLVEGDIDKAYFEALRGPEHGENALTIEGEIMAYGGKDTLKNCTVLRFMLGKYDKAFITFDLDALQDLQRHLSALGLEKGRGYLPVGIDQAGMRDIEGLVPDDIRSEVYKNNVALVQGAMSAKPEERKEAKQQLKQRIFDQFTTVAKPGTEHFARFYDVVKKINKAMAEP